MLAAISNYKDPNNASVQKYVSAQESVSVVDTIAPFLVCLRGSLRELGMRPLTLETYREKHVMLYTSACRQVCSPILDAAWG